MKTHTVTEEAVQRVRDGHAIASEMIRRTVDDVLTMLGLPLVAPVERPAPEAPRQCANCGRWAGSTGDVVAICPSHGQTHRTESCRTWCQITTAKATEQPMMRCEHAISGS